MKIIDVKKVNLQYNSILVEKMKSCKLRCQQFKAIACLCLDEQSLNEMPCVHGYAQLDVSL